MRKTGTGQGRCIIDPIGGARVDNPDPNAHDYQQLETIYAHLDSTTTVASMPAEVANAELNAPAEWGRQVHASGRASVYERDFGDGHKVFTFVTWADVDHARTHRHEAEH